MAASNSNQRQRPEQIASWGRLVGFLLIGVGVVALGFLAQHAPAGGGGAAPGQLASHNNAIPIYLMAIFMDWALLYYCWAGVHHHDGNLKHCRAGDGPRGRASWLTLDCALPFWVL
jgi:hypothetical protein